MASRTDFVNVVTEYWKNHSIYFWGGNGESTRKLTIGTIIDQESSAHNAARVLRHIADLIDKGYSLTCSQAMDCSGLVVAALRQLGLIKPTDDFRARDLQKMCRPIELNKLKYGDLVFDKQTEATHCGVYDGFDMTIEAQGRDVGVTRNKLSAGKWVIGGRLKYFE